jgi:hypothetical protein
LVTSVASIVKVPVGVVTWTSATYAAPPPTPAPVLAPIVADAE